MARLEVAYAAWEQEVNSSTEAALWDAIRSALERITRRMCLLQGVPEQEVQDIASGALLAVFEAFPGFDKSKSPIGAWLNMIATQRITDEIMKFKARNKCDELNEGDAVLLDPERKFLEVISQNAALKELLADLSEDDKLFIYLKFWHGLTEDELAERFNKVSGRMWANNKWKYLRKKLKAEAGTLAEDACGFERWVAHLSEKPRFALTLGEFLRVRAEALKRGL